MRTRTSTALMIAALFALGGCGSGSDNPSNDLPDGDVGGPPPPPVAEKVMVNGQVTDAPVPNATVVINVAEQQFTAPNPTGADGSFSVEIESNDPNALVFCEAFDPNGVVRFAAVPNSFADLQALADESGVVEGMNITNVTTAHVVLAERNIEGGVILSLDDLSTASRLVNAERLLDLAAAIKVVVENRDGVVIPAEYADTLELAEAIVDGSSSFLTDVEITNPGTLAAAADDVLTDGNATVAFDSAEVPGVYVDAASSPVFALLDGGVGVLYAGGDLVRIPNWTVDPSGRLNLSLPTDMSQEYVLTRLSHVSGVASAFVSVEDPTGQEPDAVSYVTMLRMGFDGAFDGADFMGSYAASANPDTLLVFSNDGSGHVADAASGGQLESFTWQVTDGRLSLTFDGRVESYHRLEGSDVTMQNVLMIATATDGSVVGLEIETLEKVE